jgi:mycothiol synthase
MSSSRPEALTVRPATLDDVGAVVGVARAHELSLGLETATTTSEILEWWARLDLANDSWLLEEGGRLVAFASVYRRDDSTDGFGMVHPDAHGRGLGTMLLELGEQHARDAGFRCFRTSSYAPDADARVLLDSRGYRPVRRFYEMVIRLDERPRPPVWPEGIRVAPFRLEDARAFYEAANAAFADEWGFAAMTFGEWHRLRVEDADTSYYSIAWDGDEIAGLVRGEPEIRGMGWIGMVGVLPRWRRRGLGEALLLHAFGEFHRRGERTIGLGVDAENPNRATRLYEKVGMHVTLEDVVYELELS